MVERDRSCDFDMFVDEGRHIWEFFMITVTWEGERIMRYYFHLLVKPNMNNSYPFLIPFSLFPFVNSFHILSCVPNSP